MTLYQYNMLTENERAGVLWGGGVYLDTRACERYRVNLYALCSFYVEAWYDPEGNRLEKLRAFSSVSQLDPYLNFGLVI